MSWSTIKTSNVEKPASKKQIDYIAVLSIELNGDINISLDHLTMSEAAVLINDLLEALGTRHIHHSRKYYEEQSLVCKKKWVDFEWR